jgi:uncharacterized OB-fold protein
MMDDPEGPYQQYAGGGLFVRKCPACGRIVKADPTVLVNGLDEISEEANATCSKCGRVTMPFLGYYEEA